MSAIDDILQWASKLSPWRQDALRRLAQTANLTDNDRDELLAAIQEQVGFTVQHKPPALSPLTKAHFSGVTGGTPLRLKAIQKVENVNRLVPSASLSFIPDGLTIIYGRNGSGKSGFVRIFRTACRTRVDDPAKLKVLANVYGTTPGPQKAEIIIDQGKGDVPIEWTAGAPAKDELLQVAVFDSSAAQLYVDAGNRIQFLPFGLALPHKLNELCLALKGILEGQRKLVTDQLALAVVTFEKTRTTKAQTFYSTLAAKTSDDNIRAATKFDDSDEARLAELNKLLSASGTSATDIRALAVWIRTLDTEIEAVVEKLNDTKLDQYSTLRQAASGTRSAADLDAKALFSSEPLQGVGGETWRRLWLAARDFSISDAYPEQDFPVTSEGAKCVLCLQDLSPGASERLLRFQTYISGSLAKAAEKYEAEIEAAISTLPALNLLSSKDWAMRIEQIKKRDSALAATLDALKDNLVRRLQLARQILSSEKSLENKALTTLENPALSLAKLATSLSTEADNLTVAEQSGARQKLESELAELIDKKLLASRQSIVFVRRNLLIQDGLYSSALAEVQTKGITQKANELVDAYLTTAVTHEFENERQALEIAHLKVSLARKSGQTKAMFQTDPGSKLVRSASEVLSEGEQRALALAAFFTEVSVTEGSGPIVIDDPISSLDRQRGLKVANRIVLEAQKRQAIVFTHDLVFFNDLCNEAEDQGVKTQTIALFSDGDDAGKIDPAGISWKGLSVKKRIGVIRNEFAPIKKLHLSNPSDYELKVKNLYGRLRDTYERVVEECIFCDIVRRGVDKVETQKLRYVHLSDALAIRFHEGMTKANTYSHDNPASDSIAVPAPAEFEEDITFIETLIGDLRAENIASEAKRPTMKSK